MSETLHSKRPSSKLRRFVAYMLDGFIIFIIIFVIVLILMSIGLLDEAFIDKYVGVDGEKLEEITFKNALGFLVISYLCSYILFFLYSVVYPLANNGQTLGRKALGIKIVNEDGTDVTFSRLFLREIIFVNFIGGFFDGLVLLISSLFACFSETNTALHDKFSKTMVVYDDEDEEYERNEVKEPVKESEQKQEPEEVKEEVKEDKENKEIELEKELNKEEDKEEDKK